MAKGKKTGEDKKKSKKQQQQEEDEQGEDEEWEVVAQPSDAAGAEDDAADAADAEEESDKENHEEKDEQQQRQAGVKRKAAASSSPSKKGRGSAAAAASASADDGGDDADDDVGRVMAYMRRANRPYSATVLFENLHRSVTHFSHARTDLDAPPPSARTDGQRRSSCSPQGTLSAEQVHSVDVSTAATRACLPVHRSWSCFCGAVPSVVQPSLASCGTHRFSVRFALRRPLGRRRYRGLSMTSQRRVSRSGSTDGALLMAAWGARNRRLCSPAHTSPHRCVLSCLGKLSSKEFNKAQLYWVAQVALHWRRPHMRGALLSFSPRSLAPAR